MDNTDTPTNGGNAPTHIAYQMSEIGQRRYRTNIGAAWAHKDGNGFSIQLNCLPIDGKITLRIASDNK